ncbi:hypothetical protein HUJ04_007416 [Dendroctonus ponderosae]|uniref:CAP-Gly domain-containing protein n=1 Tax=Dendroctonus ponderosae TaxID=77166 RepID=A0AAR5QIP0_DENPD|nr:hypothetical protein HUJ04_007416 [Dendroctonus ponderosae]
MDFGGAVSQSGGLETVRALHQTIVALRAALEESKNEILELKTKAWPVDSVEEVIHALSIENHVLRRKIVETELETPRTVKEFTKPEDIFCTVEDVKHFEVEEKKSIECQTDSDIYLQAECESLLGLRKEQETDSYLNSRPTIKPHKFKNVTIISPTESLKQSSSKKASKLQTRISIKAKKTSNNASRSLESLTVLKYPLDKSFSFKKTLSFSNLTAVKREFTFKEEPDDTMSFSRENSEEAVPNRYDEQLMSPQNDLDQEVDDIELIFTTDDTKDQDFKEELVPIDSRESNSNLLNFPLSDLDQVSDRELDDDVFNDDSNPEQTNYRQSSFEVKRDNSIFNSRSDNSINHEKSLKSFCSYQDSSFENKSLEKDESFDRFEERVRIVETDISKCGIHEVEYVGSRRNTCPNPIQYRPVSHRDAVAKGLSSRKCRPILTHSNAIRRESGAQTDISALPGSAWRSESSIGNKAKFGDTFTTLPSKYPLPGSRLRLSEKTVEARRVLLSDIGFTSMVPELSRSADHLSGPGSLKPPTVTSYGQFLKATDLYSPSCLSNKFAWTATTATPSESSRTPSRYSSISPLSPPAPSRRCSAPVSPSRRALLKNTPSKVRFANGSLPELRSDWSTVDSGDSTDSLVDEAEVYLRRSIDCFVTSKDPMSYGDSRRMPPRRASAPEPTRDNVPPQGWQPFLPRLPRDLKPENWVKVITSEGKVRGGRVRYVGPVVMPSQEHFVGVQLSFPEGLSDGTYGGRRYFQCEPYHGIFVPFKKVIMGWRP